MEEKERIGYLIHKIDKKIKVNADNDLFSHDLTFSQSQILHHLQKNGGSLSQKQLQDLLKASHPTIVGLVQRLEAKGYVECFTDPNDRRYKIVKQTALAERLKEDLIKTRKKFERKMIQGISKEEIDELYRILNKMYENINQEGGRNVKNSGR